MKIKKYKLYIFLFVVIAIVGFITLGLPSLTGEISIQTYSDSLTYEYIAKEYYKDVSFFSVASNVLGPVLVLKFFDYNYVAIFIFNIILLLSSFYLIFKYYNINKKIFLFFIFLSPLIFFSLFNVNKEIFVIFNIALFLVFLKNRKYIIFVFIIPISYLIRWQLSAFFILSLLLIIIDKYFKKRKLLLFLFVLGLSIIYPSIRSLFKDVVDHGNRNNDLMQGSGIFLYLKSIQDLVGGYTLVFIPKLMQINFGLAKRINMLFYFDEFWNYFVLLLHSWASIILTLYVLIKRKFTFKNELIYFAMIYGALFGLTPIISVRYFLPMYLLFAVIASQKNKNGEIN